MNKNKRRLIALISAFSVLINSLSFWSPLIVLAQETQEGTPVVENQPQQTETSTPQPTESVAETTTPVPSVSPSLEPSLAPSQEPSPANNLQTETPTPTATPAQEVLGTNTNTTTPLPSTPASEDKNKDAHINAVVLNDVSASSVEEADLSYLESATSATLRTDKFDYSPTDAVVITGEGFAPNTEYELVITSNTGNFRFSDRVTSDESGGLFYTYQLDGTYRPEYKVEVFDLLGISVVSVNFLDNNNGKVGLCHRTNSNSNPYVYVEADIKNNGDLKGGHLDHKGPVWYSGIEGKWGDIIPPYSTGNFNYLGMNWTDGQAIWDNNCKLQTACQEGPSWASGVISFNQGKNKDGSDVSEERSDPYNALGEPDSSGNDVNFVSLGKGGYIVLAFLGWVKDQEGNDLSFHEVTWGRENYPQEKAKVEVSQDGTNWYGDWTVVSSKDTNGVGYVDFSSTGLSWIKYVRITDTTDFSLHDDKADGYDLDAVDAVYQLCSLPSPTPTPTPTPTPAPVCGNGVKEVGEGCDGTDGVTPGQNFCTATCHLVPIYDGGHSCSPGTVKSQSPILSKTIYANDTSGETFGLTSGGKYLFEVSGTFRPTSPSGWWADAGYTTNNNWSSLATQYGIHGTGSDYAAHALLADLGSGVGVVDWGQYNPEHVYTKYYEPTSSTVTVQFVIGDRYGDWFNTPWQNQGGMGDNSGSLTLNVYECQPNTGNLQVKKVVDWKDFTPDKDKTFEICITGPSYPNPNCKTADYDGETLEWKDILAGNYTVTETTPTGGWIVTGSGQTVTVNKDQTSYVKIKNEVNPVVIKAYKVVCDSEQYLPNWGNHGSVIGADTAQSFVNNSQGHCRLEGGWKFQYAPKGSGSNGQFQTNTQELGAPWKTFGPTVGGEAVAVINDISNFGGRIETREVFKDNTYIPFSNSSNNVSAEFYCTGDTYNYDNWEWINNPQYGSTYYCVAFNAPNYGSVSGYKWEDLNGDGNWDEIEPVVDGSETNVTIFIDLDLDGKQEEDEPRTDIAEDGSYSFEDLLPGEYSVCERVDLLSGWVATKPRCQGVTVSAGQDSKVNFGNFRLAKIQGRKYNDLNGDGTRDSGEPYLNGWTIRAYKKADSGWTLLDSVLSGHTGNVGQYRFEGLGPGRYKICEVLQEGWVQTSPTGAANRVALDEAPRCRVVDINLSGEINSGRNFGNFELGSIDGYKYDEDGETGIPGWTIFIDKDGKGDLDEGETSAVTDSTGYYKFDGLTAGTYSVCEVEQEGWQRMYPLGSNCQSVTITSGSKARADFQNREVVLGLSLTKSNNATTALSAGSQVTYTLKIKNTGNQKLTGVIIKDAPAGGFTYVDDSGILDSNPINPTQLGGYLDWYIGDLDAGEEKVLSYKMSTNSGMISGIYPSVAIAAGIYTPSEYQSEEVVTNRSLVVEALAVDGDSGEERVESNAGVPVNSQVEIKAPLAYSTGVGGTGGQVLGASTEAGEVLPAAGSDSRIVLFALLGLILGALLKVSGLALERDWVDYRKLKKNIKRMGSFIAVLIFLLGFAPSARAFSDYVYITQLPAYLNKEDFKISYSALSENPIFAQFYIRKDGDSSWRTLGSPLSGASGYVQVHGGDIYNGDGKYFFKVVINSGSAEDQTSTIIDRQSPDPVRDYWKEKLGDGHYKLHWRNPDNEDFDKVIIYRSDSANFTADSSTEIATVWGTRNSEMTYENAAAAGKEYYFAIRAIDKAGNVSSVVADPETQVSAGAVLGESTVATGSPKAEVVKILPKEEKKGEVLGEENKEEETVSSPTPEVQEQAGGVLGQAIKFAKDRTKITLLIALGLGVVSYYLSRLWKKNKN